MGTTIERCRDKGFYCSLAWAGSGDRFDASRLPSDRGIARVPHLPVEVLLFVWFKHWIPVERALGLLLERSEPGSGDAGRDGFGSASLAGNASDKRYAGDEASNAANGSGGASSFRYRYIILNRVHGSWHSTSGNAESEDHYHLPL